MKEFSVTRKCNKCGEEKESSEKNLQPLWAKENNSKGEKLMQPFQQALII